MPRNPEEKRNVSWENRYGTTASGNLSQYIVGACVEDVVDIDLIRSQPGMSWVDLEDFHYYNIKCPYSIESDFPYVRDGNIFSPTYWMAIDVSGEAAAHVSTSGIMIRYNRGSKYGWLCVDPNCPYYRGIASGTVGGSRYFYI